MQTEVIADLLQTVTSTRAGRAHLFGSDDDPPGGDKIERHLELVFSVDRKVA